MPVRDRRYEYAWQWLCGGVIAGTLLAHLIYLLIRWL